MRWPKNKKEHGCRKASVADSWLQTKEKSLTLLFAWKKCRKNSAEISVAYKIETIIEANI